MANLTALQTVELQKKFTHHTPVGDQPTRYVIVREALMAAAAVVLEQSVPSREQSLALTKLEEAMFWANEGIARNG